MLNRKVIYLLYPGVGHKARLRDTALEEHIRLSQEIRKGSSFTDPDNALTPWRKSTPALSGLNAQSGQVTLKRLHLAFQNCFWWIRDEKTPGFPRFRSIHRYTISGYKTHGNGWKLRPGESGTHAHYAVGQWNHPHPTVAEVINADITCIHTFTILSVSEMTEDCSLPWAPLSPGRSFQPFPWVLYPEIV